MGLIKSTDKKKLGSRFLTQAICKIQGYRYYIHLNN